jgi:hypothetical protein
MTGIGASILQGTSKTVSQRFTREEFYDLVWSKPITHLAKDFRLSDVALHKICRKHDIPKPERGWWAKLAAGHSLSRTPLPELKSDKGGTIVIAAGVTGHEAEDIAQVRERARILASETDVGSEIAAHPIVTKSIARLRKAKVGHQGLVAVAQQGLIAIEIAPASIDRIELALNRIVAAAGVQGFVLSGKGERAVFEGNDLAIPFSLKEAVKRCKHVPTEAELAAEEQRRKQNERRWSRSSWDTHFDFDPNRRWPEWDHIPTGQVSFELEVYLRHSSQLRRSFKDAKIQRLENLAADIAVGLSVLAAAKREDNAKAEAARDRAEEERLLRIEAKRRAYVEERRGKVLNEVLGRMERRDHLMRVVSQLTAELAANPSPRTTEFVRWANTVLQRAEERMSSAGLEALFTNEHVFGEDDDRGFYCSPSGW